MMSANVVSSAAISSADLLTDLKSGYLLGANPRKQFLAQLADGERALRVDLIAPVALTRLLVPMMPASRSTRGKIINISGGGAAAPRPNFSAYAVAKPGLVRFTETLAGELAAAIDVNAVAPGPMKSAMTQAVLHAGRHSAGDREYDSASQVAACSDGGVECAAELCAFLASPASDGITGRLVSAVWDRWEELPRHLEDLKRSDVYTLRRVVPGDRGMTWGGER